MNSNQERLVCELYDLLFQAAKHENHKGKTRAEVLVATAKYVFYNREEDARDLVEACLPLCSKMPDVRVAETTNLRPFAALEFELSFGSLGGEFYRLLDPYAGVIGQDAYDALVRHLNEFDQAAA